MAARKRYSRRKSRSRSGSNSSSKQPLLPKGMRRYFMLLFILAGLILASMVLGQVIVYEIIPAADRYLHTHQTANLILLVSFLVSMTIWQGFGFLKVLAWLFTRLITMGMIQLDAPTQPNCPPASWQLIPICAIICALFGVWIGLANEGLSRMWLAIDFSIIGAVWGAFLNILAYFRLLPFAQQAQDYIRQGL